MKKNLFSLAAICVIFAAIFTMTGCPTEGGDEPTSNATLTSVKFGNEVATLGTPAATFGAAKAGSVTILQKTANITAVPKDSKAEIEYAVAKQGVLNEDDFWSDTSLDFATGDFLAIKVTASDKKTTLIYKIGVTLADVALATLSIDNKNITLPNPAGSWQAATAGAALFSYKVDEQPAAGIRIVTTVRTEGATVKYGHAVADGTPDFDSSDTIKFLDGEFLYIEVTGTSGKAYYKIQVNFKQSATIKYGSPTMTQSSVDPLWDTVTEVYPIKKIYPGDSAQLLDPGNGLLDANGESKTIATAKAMWDEEGLSVYVKVIDSDVSQVDNEHETDSFELFVNEGFPDTSYANGGSQYRVAAGGQASGEGGSPDAMKALNKYTAFKTNDGYVILLKAPWRLRSKFFGPTTYRSGWEFGFELQINVAAETGNRYGVLVWNNVAHTNYQNATDYGKAQLEGGPANPVYPAVPPNITAITPTPNQETYSTGDSISINVTAVSKDGGALTYEWYKSTVSGTDAGEKITGPTTGTYAFTAPDSTAWYYVKITNTLTNSLGTTTGVANSSRIKINVSNAPQVDKVSLVNGGYVVYKIELPAGTTWGDYSGLTAQYYINGPLVDGAVRGSRLMGNYKAADFSESGNILNASLNDFNAPYILDNTNKTSWTDLGATADTWFTVSYDISGTKAHGSFASDNLPAATATGPFYFGVGLAGQANNHATPGPIVQYIKNVTLVHKTDATKNAVSAGAGTNSGFAKPAFVSYGDPELTVERESDPAWN